MAGQGSAVLAAGCAASLSVSLAFAYVCMYVPVLLGDPHPQRSETRPRPGDQVATERPSPPSLG